MSNVALVVPALYQRDRLFCAKDPVVNRDDCMRPWIELRTELEARGVRLVTHDQCRVQSAQAVIFMDIPYRSDPVLCLVHESCIPLIAVMGELGFIHPPNFDRGSHAPFCRVFTYRDDYIDQERYFKINYSFSLPRRANRSMEARTRLCTLIAAKKFLQHPLELYSERIRAIRWFERHHPEDFDLYGRGWRDLDRFTGPLFLRALNRIPLARRLLTRPFPSYRGPVESKSEALQHYRFAICYENARDVPGWITEKLFDCFFAGCVPVYWGANNVAEHIPPECFIDRRSFHTYEELYRYITSMSEEAYLSYLDAIDSFLTGPRSFPFSVEHFVQSLTAAIMHLKRR